MVLGTYVFILKVTDSGGQSNEAQVKVVVLAEQNTVPVAVAGDDKVFIEFCDFLPNSENWICVKAILIIRMK